MVWCVVFEINSTRNAARKESSTWLSLVLFYSLAALLVLLIPNTTSNHPITLVQLKHVLNSTNLPAKPKSDPNACEDFLEVVSVAHIIGACMEILGMKSIDDEPDPSIVPSGLKFKDKKRKEEVLAKRPSLVLAKFQARCWMWYINTIAPALFSPLRQHILLHHMRRTLSCCLRKSLKAQSVSLYTRQETWCV